MSSLIFLVPLALALGAVALAAFLWSLRSGQYEDLQGAAERIFVDENGDRAGSSHTPSPVPGRAEDKEAPSPAAAAKPRTATSRTGGHGNQA